MKNILYIRHTNNFIVKNYTLGEGTHYMEVIIVHTFLKIIFWNFLQSSLCDMQETSERIY